MELFIYKITNKLNGYCYIGLTNDYKRRWHQHIHNKSNSLIHLAISRYGEDNFSFEVLERGITTYARAAQKEIYYIEKFNSKSPRGYNKTIGGETPEKNYSKTNSLPLSDTEKYRKKKRKELNKLHKENKRQLDAIRRKSGK